MLQNFPKTTGSSGRAFVVEHCQETAKLFFFILISLLLIFLRIFSIILLDIQAFGWNSKGFPKDLKNLIFPWLCCLSGNSKSFLPLAAFAIKAIVKCYFAFFPPYNEFSYELRFTECKSNLFHQSSIALHHCLHLLLPAVDYFFSNICRLTT